MNTFLLLSNIYWDMLHGSDEKENELKNFTYFPQDADRRAKSSIQTDPGN